MRKDTARNENFYESKGSTDEREGGEEFLKMDEHVERRRMNEPLKWISLNQFEDVQIKG